MAKKSKVKQLNSRVALNRIKIESLPSFIFSGEADIVPYGLDNLYPTRIIDAIKKSPTALGCIEAKADFIFGQGVKEGGDVVVNRDGETLNDIIMQSIRFGFTTLGGFALHFNLNGLGEVCEIFSVSQEYLRKHTSMRQVEFGLWGVHGHNIWGDQSITMDLYGGKDAIKLIPEGGFNEYKGQIYYFSRYAEIYPTSPLDSAVISASYEREAQVYPYANIKNGFSGNTIIKLPTMLMGDNAAAEADKVQESIEKLHGAENAGGSVVVTTPVDANGTVKNFQMIENLSPTNIDGLFVNQNLKAQNDILKVYNMQGELIGIPAQGAFSRAAYDQAFDVQNGRSEKDRKTIEREFNKFLPNTCFGINEIELVPLEDKIQEPQAQENELR